MKLSLNVKMGMQLAITPQLRQAIRLLQLSTLELQQEIQQALQENPMLELAEELEDPAAQAREDAAESGEATPPPEDSRADPQAGPDEAVDAGTTPTDGAAATAEDGDGGQVESTLGEGDLGEGSDGDDSDGEDGWQEQIPAELSVDSSWDDIYQSSPSPSGRAAAGETFDPAAREGQEDREDREGAEETLQDHLLWQLNLTPMSDRDRQIALAIIDGIDTDGLLTVSIEAIRDALAPTLTPSGAEVLAVLHRIQRFDPVGVACRGLAECLLVQLGQFEDSPGQTAVADARAVITDHLDLLASHDFARLRRQTGLDAERLRAAIALIESLNPRPGADIAPPSTDYVTPDVLVSKDPETGQLRVELNEDIAPNIRINDRYAALVKRAENSADRLFLRDKLQQARWFLKSLRSRNETLFKVASRIVEHQRDFFEHGEEAMKPLVLHDIAAAVAMHESTISRATTQKYMHTPRGTFELKYFFSSHVSTRDGGECSAVAIRAIIKRLVAGEDKRQPLSDSKIAHALEDRGIDVARRTVAKYREALAIPPSHERKQWARP